MFYYRDQTRLRQMAVAFIGIVKKNESDVLEEVHLYISDSLFLPKPDGGSVQIVFSKIQLAEVYVKAGGRTTAS